MRPLLVLALFVAIHATKSEAQLWKFPQDIFDFSWLRQGKTEKLTSSLTSQSPNSVKTTLPISTTEKIRKKATVPMTTIVTDLANFTTTPAKLTKTTKAVETRTVTPSKRTNKHKTTTVKSQTQTQFLQTQTQTQTQTQFQTSPIWTTVPLSTQRSRATTEIEIEETSTGFDFSTTTTTPDATATTEEPRDNHRVHDFYLKREKPQVKISSNISQNLLPLPAGASAALVKPTKYHYYPHNQHIYLLPECAIQQVCNAVYVRLNWTQPLCACPSRYRDPCSASLNSDDLHTTELLTDPKRRKALTLVKTCEPTAEMRICRTPRDWSLLALQNIRTGKSHYLVICRCPDSSILEGPMSHDQPTYASVPGIRVYGMMCVQGNNKRRGRPLRLGRAMDGPPFPWDKAIELSKTVSWD